MTAKLTHFVYAAAYLSLFSPLYGMSDEVYNQQKVKYQATLSTYSRFPNTGAYQDAKRGLASLEATYKAQREALSSPTRAASTPTPPPTPYPPTVVSTRPSTSILWTGDEKKEARPSVTTTTTPPYEDLGENRAGQKYFRYVAHVSDVLLKPSFDDRKYTFYFGYLASPYGKEEEDMLADLKAMFSKKAEQEGFEEAAIKYVKIEREHEFYSGLLAHANTLKDAEKHLPGLRAYLKEKQKELEEILQEINVIGKGDKTPSAPSSPFISKKEPDPLLYSPEKGFILSSKLSEEEERFAQKASDVVTAAQDFQTVNKVSAIDAHAVSAQIKKTYPLLVAAVETFFGKAPPLTSVEVEEFLNKSASLSGKMTFFELENKKTPLSPQTVRKRFLDGWKEHTGKVSTEAGVNVDHVRSVTLYAMHELLTKVGVSDETLACLQKVLTQGSDAQGTCLEGHTNRHYLALLFILQTYVQHMEAFKKH